MSTFSFASRFSLATSLLLTACLSGCALFASQDKTLVFDQQEYARLERLLPKEMNARGLTDSWSKGDRSYGQILYKQLSPDFLVGETKHHVYLGENFHATLTPSSRESFDADGQGFTLLHPTQRLSIRMVAIVDWNQDGKNEWLIRCRVTSYKGARIRDYYVLAPIPESEQAMTHGIIAASVDDRGLATPIVQVRDTSELGQNAGAIPLTDLQEGLPGQGLVTAPPSKAPQSGLEERDL